MLPTVRRNVLNLRSIPDFRWDVDRLFNGNVPAADLIETEDEFTLEMNLPGYRLEDIDVNLEQGVLMISGSRRESEEDETGMYHVRERSWGRFTRSFTVPHTIDATTVKAEFADGVLTISLPKAEEARPRRIEVTGR